jgi:uroporphyrinogen-III synthase
VTYQASNSTQEGMIELLKLVQLKNKKIILPRSNLARKVIDAYLIDQKIPFETIDCYRTQFNPQHVKSNLNEFDALLFTSPSTVKFFFDFYTEIQSFLLFLVIGDITYRELIKSKNLKNKIEFINK